MKKSEFLTQVAVALVRYPKTVRSIRTLQLQETYLGGPYIGDQLDHDLMRWSPESAVVLSAPTGSGKTTFVVKKIIARAVKRSENVLIITNRNPLNLAYKKDVAKAVGMINIFIDEGLKSHTDFGNVFVVNYQGFTSFIKARKHLYFHYVIADEGHYFLQDAPFSDCTDHVLNSIKKYFFDAIRIYVSATIDDILPFIILAENPDVLKELVENKKFSHKCMATTSVFSNGNNILDCNVKTVVIDLLDPVEILQMAGRRRLSYTNPDDGFDLYMKIPELSDLEKKFNENKRKLNLIDRYEAAPKKVLYAMKGNESDDKFISSIYRVDTEGFGYSLNQLAYDKIYIDMKYAEFIHALISAGGEKAYCQYICNLFSKDFDEEMLTCSLQDRHAQLEDYIKSQPWPMDKESFQSFCKDFQYLKIKLFGKSSTDNTSSARKAPGVRWLNNRFEDYNIPFQVVEKDDLFNINEKLIIS